MVIVVCNKEEAPKWGVNETLLGEFCTSVEKEKGRLSFLRIFPGTDQQIKSNGVCVLNRKQ